MATVSLTQQMDTAISEMNSATNLYYRKKYFKIALDLYNSHPSIQRAWDYIKSAHYIVDRFRRKAMVWVAPSKCIDLGDIVPFEKGTNQVYVVYCRYGHRTRRVDAEILNCTIFGNQLE